MRSSAVKALIVLATFGAAAIALGQGPAQTAERDWSRFHVGIAAGASQLGADTSDAGVPEHIWGNHSVESGLGRKLVVGFRPFRIVGVEFQFVDFGEGEADAHAGRLLGGGQVRFWEQTISMTASSEARMLGALVFIPDASPSRDLYAKVGVAHLEESFTASAADYLTPECQPSAWLVPPTFRQPASCSFSSDVDRSDSVAYLGFGARFKIARAAGVRLEYEAVDRDGGDPHQLLSVGIAVEF